jgi:hypothetical protein
VDADAALGLAEDVDIRLVEDAEQVRRLCRLAGASHLEFGGHVGP